MAAQASYKDGGEDSEESMQMPDFGTQPTSTQITKSDLNEALENLSNKLITIWKHRADSLRKYIQELGKRTSHMEDKCDEFATAHNDLATNMEQMVAKIETI
ncbi:Hypothetical predicted protein [Pelobates cultripes]|uniref:Uncharacterized protein n=1 Tax=Pelobates cultripes TaxID=61616 RepID=A0AAD1RZW7_PELCU|nr:Hypothetical predicted protein [Pelobates cultripes]